MNKAEEYIKRLDETGTKLNSYKKALIYRCMLLEMSEEQIGLFITSDFSLQKEEYIIASILDGISETYIREQILSEDDLDVIKQKRSDYLIDNFRANDSEYNKLKEELIMLQSQAKAFDDKYSRALEKTKQLISEIKEKEERIRRLDELLEESRNKAAKELKPQERIIEYKRPEGLIEKVRYIFGGDLDTIERTSDSGSKASLFDYIIDPEFSIKQIREIANAYTDGLPDDLIKKIANKDFADDKMRELRKFFCSMYGIGYTVTEETEHNEISKSADNNPPSYIDNDGVVISVVDGSPDNEDMTFSIDEGM